MDNRLRYMLKQNMSYYKNRLRYNFARMMAVTENIIVFESFGGASYSDSVRAIYEELLTDDSFRSYYFVWAFKEPENHLSLLENHHTILVRKGTKEYRRYYAAARYWINNVTVADYLIPRKHQTYIETWHGTPLKKLGCDITTDSDPRQTKKHMHKRYRAKGKKVDYFLSPSPYYTDKIMSAFDVSKKKACFVPCGYPRNDKLFHYTTDDVITWKKKYQVPLDKKVLLYTPTWRDSSVDADNHFTWKPGIDFHTLMNKLGDDYVLLFRAHHQIRDSFDFSDFTNILDVSTVEDVQELYLISDMMITDYSSTMFDFANLRRPMIFHMYDKTQYDEQIRGFYLPLDKLPGPVTTTTEELAEAVLTLKKQFSYDKTYQEFNRQFNPYEDGSSAKRAIAHCMKKANSKRPIWECLIRYAKKTLNRIRILHQLLNYNILGFLRSHGLFHNNNSLRLKALENAHEGERCFLIGNGPSLNGDDLNLLQEEYTFGTNMVYKIFDKTNWRPSFHCVSDTIYASKLGLELSKMVKAPLFTTERTYRRMKKKPIDTTYVHTIQTERYKVRGNVYAYCMIKATVLSLAAEMAFHMGFKEIYLLGVDCTNPHDKGGHFTDNYATKEVAETDINRIKTRMNAKTLTTKQIGEHIIDRSMEVYDLLDKYAKKHGIKIYNATRGGNLEIFPRVTLEDVLQKKNTRKKD